MSLAAIVSALRTAIAGVDGIDECYPRIPETKPAQAVFAVIESNTGTVESHGADKDRVGYAINVYVCTKRNQSDMSTGGLWAEQDTILPFADSVPAALRSAFTLGGLTYGTRYADPAWELTEVQIDDQPYLGMKFGLLYKQKVTTTFSG